MSEMSCDEYTLRTKQTSKKTWGEEEGGKLTTKTLIIIINFSQMYLWIHYKYSSTSFKQCLPEEFHGNSTLSFFFFFSGALDLDLVLQWSVQWPSDIKILNRAGVQWLCRATPEGGYTSTPKSPRNRTWPPGNVSRPTGHLSSRAC